uniref:Uncharacterized protein n=1 Tax=Nelumbo nucifera TaxID=4432 RepID=A0A822ZP90_NELNU|nr:TPA_asm: hypothetical protein HUJ06_001838 [Nelumbo nucifera]
MDGFDDEGGIEKIPNQKAFKGLAESSSEDARFDASQYAFFDKDVMEEVELGGLEDEDDDVPLIGFDDDEYPLSDREELRGENLGSLSDIDDLVSTFSKGHLYI